MFSRKLLSIATVGLGILIAQPMAHANIKGIIDNVTSSTWGWACVPGSTQSVYVHFYVGGPAGSGTYVGYTFANQYSETAVDTECGHSGVRASHRWSWTIPDTVKAQHHGQLLYVHGIDPNGSNNLLTRSGVFTIPDPDAGGVIDSLDDGVVRGWACVKGSTGSVQVKAWANSTYIGTFTASLANESAVDNACAHPGQVGHHRFAWTVPAGYAGTKLTLKVVNNTNNQLSTLSNSGRYFMPGEVSHTYNVSATNTAIQAVWDYSLTNACSNLSATALSFPGGDGTTHGTADSDETSVAREVGKKCVRFIKMNVPYWDSYHSYRDAGVLLTEAIRLGQQTSTNARDGLPYVRGKVIFLGSSSGGHIGAAALDWDVTSNNAHFRTLVDRSIFISAPLFASLQQACQDAEALWLRQWLDGIFLLGNACADQAPISACYDVVNRNDPNCPHYVDHSYLNSNSYREVTTMVGELDDIGCEPNSNCSWDATTGQNQYLQALGSWLFSAGVMGTGVNSYYTISGGTHDLWESSIARRVICQGVLIEVGASTSGCNYL